MTQQIEKNVKPSEKLKALESQLMATARRAGEMELIIYNLSRENEVIKDALQLMHDKQEATISLIREGKLITDENINNKVTEFKEKALKERVENLLEQNKIQPSDEVSENSLVVSRELNEKGEVENPRLQFLVGRLSDEIKNQFLGKKVGDLVTNEGDVLDIEIIEIYNVVEQTLGQQQNTETLQEQNTAE